MKVKPVENKLFNNIRVSLLDCINIADSHRLTAVDRCGSGYVMGISEERMALEATLKPPRQVQRDVCYSGIPVRARTENIRRPVITIATYRFME